MFLGTAWYWWLVLAAVLAVAIPFKVRFMKWWGRYRRAQKKEQPGKWGDEE